MKFFALMMPESAGFKRIEDRLLYEGGRGRPLIFERAEDAVNYRYEEDLGGNDIVQIEIRIVEDDDA